MARTLPLTTSKSRSWVLPLLPLEPAWSGSAVKEPTWGCEELHPAAVAAIAVGMAPTSKAATDLENGGGGLLLCVRAMPPLRCCQEKELPPPWRRRSEGTAPLAAPPLPWPRAAGAAATRWPGEGLDGVWYALLADGIGGPGLGPRVDGPS